MSTVMWSGTKEILKLQPSPCAQTGGGEAGTKWLHTQTHSFPLPVDPSIYSHCVIDLTTDITQQPMAKLSSPNSRNTHAQRKQGKGTDRSNTSQEVILNSDSHPVMKRQVRSDTDDDHTT
jgi:hypothetical protein